MIYDCKGFYEDILMEVECDIAFFKLKPSFNCYLIKDEAGNVDPASRIYTNLKVKSADEFGIECKIIEMTEGEFIKHMLTINKVERAILQLPAPNSCKDLFDQNVFDKRIIDVDHLSDDVFANMWLGDYNKVPATPRGIVAMLCNYFDDISGKKIAIIGSRSETTGKYLVPLLQHYNATVSLYHSRSKINHREFENYDAVVSCVGRPNLLNVRQIGVRPKFLIDVGVSRVDGKVVGDFDMDVRSIHTVTPYTNGVGLITRGMLMRNVVDSYLF